MFDFKLSSSSGWLTTPKLAFQTRLASRAKPASRVLLAVLLALGLLAAACGSDDDETSTPSDSATATTASDAEDSSSDEAQSITVYSGRKENLIGPILERFENETGISVEVRYGGSSDLALLIDEEGANTPADVFISQSPGAAGFLNQNGHLRPLSSEVTNLLPESLRAPDGTRVGLTGRQRVLVYNTDSVDEADLPDSVFALTDSRYEGRVAVAPTNGSFQDFITGMRQSSGEQATADWLAGMAANNAPNYSGNSAIVDAVVRGEVEMGLVNHYYLLRVLAEDPNATGANHYFGSQDIGSLVIATTAAVLDASDAPSTAERLLSYLLSPESQEYFATETREYPLASAAPQPENLPPLPDLTTSAISFEDLAGGLEGTINVISESGIQQ